MTAFNNWKVNVEYDLTYDYNLRQRATSLNIVAGILKKNISFVQKLSFLSLKDFSDESSKQLIPLHHSHHHHHHSSF